MIDAGAGALARLAETRTRWPVVIYRAGDQSERGEAAPPGA
jgi:hypothetical protein